MATLAHRLLEQRIEELDQQITSLKLRVGQQVVHLDELTDTPRRPSMHALPWTGGLRSFHCSNNSVSTSTGSLRSAEG